MAEKINLSIEWKAFKNAQFGRNFTFKTRQIYERAEQILFVTLVAIFDTQQERIFVEETDIHRRMVKEIAGVARQRFPKLSPTSLNIYIRVWNTFLHSLLKDELIQRRAKIERLKEQKRDRGVLSDDQYIKVTTTKVKHEDGLNLYRVHTMVLTALGTGARLNEVLMLLAEDLNFDQSLLNIYSGKGRKQRVIPMSPALAKTLFRYIQRRNIPPSNLIFGSKVNRTPRSKVKNPTIKYPYKRMSSSNVVRDLAALCEHLNIPRFKFHQLRHTFATRYLKNGGNPANLRRLMGHSSILTTMIYEHMDKDAVFERFSDFTPF